VTSPEKPESGSDAVIAITLREDVLSFEDQRQQRGLGKLTGLLLLANIQRVVLRRVRRQSPNSVHPRASTVRDWRHLRNFMIRRVTN